METFDPRKFEKKVEIANTAADLYVAGNGQFTIRDVAANTELDPAEVFDYFHNKKAILQFYYASLVIRYEMMIDEIEDFNSYSLSEKLSNFAYTSFDMLSEKQAFVEATFEKLILRSYTKTDFEEKVEQLTKNFLENDSRLTVGSAVVLNSCFYSFLRRQYLELVQFWLNDSSEGRELTFELVDKLTNLIQEFMYNAILDRSLDLVKFLAANKDAFLRKIPIVKQFYTKIEIR